MKGEKSVEGGQEERPVAATGSEAAAALQATARGEVARARPAGEADPQRGTDGEPGGGAAADGVDVPKQRSARHAADSETGEGARRQRSAGHIEEGGPWASWTR
ncbi:hypothetical protein I3F58_15410 [Streptomyces sp. MUM 203J]|uniref:hypothetical protein n=1 Tax=Streptomyces sp. MUM 203J TaxID=2791990 RepID=UPI001F04A058|nr:hypothetical protein [Streptomyces sp. MUM 203J]MCH0540932.1 hypothetical protein [Streptomyces sp. MUM 203J]